MSFIFASTSAAAAATATAAAVVFVTLCLPIQLQLLARSISFTRTLFCIVCAQRCHLAWVCIQTSVCLYVCTYVNMYVDVCKLMFVCLSVCMFGCSRAFWYSSSVYLFMFMLQIRRIRAHTYIHTLHFCFVGFCFMDYYTYVCRSKTPLCVLLVFFYLTIFIQVFLSAWHPHTHTNMYVCICVVGVCVCVSWHF